MPGLGVPGLGVTGRAPAFWWRVPGWRSRLLQPAAAAYGAVAGWRLDHGERADAGLPVICVGNFTVGGGGKTPTALALGRAARALGLVPGFLSRGHGGSARDAVLVDPARHDASLVGDEPLLLAALGPTAVAVDRRRGAALLVEAGADLVVMDDGFQSQRLRIDLALLVVDAGRGLGNGCVVPAGPLRAPIDAQIRRTDALLVVGDGTAADAAIRLAARAGRPVHRAHVAARDPGAAAGQAVLAFAGIADPAKFHRTLGQAGAAIRMVRDFPDHHPFTAEEIAELRSAAARDGLRLATTAKDAARLAGRGPEAEALLAETLVLDVDLVFEAADLGARLIRRAEATFRQRRATAGA